MAEGTSDISNDVELCPRHMIGTCLLVPYVHGIMCELCHKACLHPYDENQKKAHIELCEKELERDREISFAIQRTVDKTCGICLEVVTEKEPGYGRWFGILENCNHVFCMACILEWRSSTHCESNQPRNNELDPDLTRACPVCRTTSDFIISSEYYVDNGEYKKGIITEHKKYLSEESCKYFNKGKGTCPLGGACFYLHAKPDGTKVELPMPTRSRLHNHMSRYPDILLIVNTEPTNRGISDFD